MPIQHSNTLTKRRLWCLFALMKKEPIDIGLLMAREMIEARNTRNISLPYAKIISVLLFKNGIPLRFYQQSFGKGDINTSYFNQYIFGLPPKKSKPPPPPPAPTEPSSSQPREPPIDQEQRMQLLETSLSSCKTDLADIRAHLAKQDERMEALHTDVRKCLMLLLGKPEHSYVPPMVGTSLTDTPAADPSEEEEEEDTEEEEAETLSETPSAAPIPSAALDILVDTSLSSDPVDESKKRKRDTAAPES